MPRKVTREGLPGYFWARVNKSSPDGCWTWAGALINGYGELRLRGISQSPVRAHRVAWELTRGPIPPGMCVLHKCDNRPCCNPGHLFLGTKQDNNADRDAKGRTASGDRSGARTHPERQPRGERHGHAKLTSNEVVAIRNMCAAGGVSQRQVAAKFLMSQQQVSRIVQRKNWRHVTQERRG